MGLRDGTFDKSDIALIIAIATAIIFNSFIGWMFINAELDFKISGTADANTFVVVFLGIMNSVIVFVGIRQKTDTTSEKLLLRLVDKITNSSDEKKGDNPPS